MTDTDKQTDDELETGAPKNPESDAAAHETPPGEEAAEAGTEPGSEPSTDEVIARLTAELDTLRDDKLRALADAQNTRRRAEKEVADTRAYAVSSFAKDLLDVADSLSRAVASAEEADLESLPEPVKNLVDGVIMTEKALLAKLERHGVKKVDPQPGDHFDPHRHQAVAQIPSDQPAGRIAAAMQTGYVLGDRTLRAAMVAVSAGQSGGGGETPQSPGGSVDVKA